MTLLTIREAAAAIRMSEGWIKKAIRDGNLQALHFGRSVRIRPEALEEYILKIAGDTESRGAKLRAVATNVYPLNQRHADGD